jgi:hypothetical protein
MLFPERALLRLLPKILRARDFHLYLENGKRLTDLWLAGGRAVLGHKPSGVLLELKNSAERGLFTPLPHPMEKRFLKALAQLFPGRNFRIYSDFAGLSKALAEAGFCLPDGAGGKSAALWRPFYKTPDYAHGNDEYEDEIPNEGKAHILIPVLPWPLGPEVLVLLDKDLETFFPAGDLVSPVMLAPATRALYDLLAALKGRVHNHYPKIEKALGGVWRRQGIYITVEPEPDMEKYEAIFRRFLEGGFLIPPSPAEPIILPASMSSGEESKLAELIRAEVLGA